ncbi:MAG: hypothetical protein IJP27_04370, partial [Clostridia bacterium]|nr:hypothetical protein [Clostridia bacterium]
MKRWRRMTAIFLSVLLLLSMSACKKKESAEDQAGAAPYVPSEQASEKDVVLPNQTGSETAPQKEETPTVQPPSEDQEESNRPAAATLALCTYPEVAPYQPDEKVYSKEERKALRKKWNEEREAERVLAQSAGEIDSFWLKTLDPCLADEGNTLYSPLNMYLMMALLAETTEGAAQAELLALLDAASVEEVRQKATALWKSHYRADGAVDLILACSIWLAQELDCNAETLDRLQSNYYVSVFRGMMGSEAYNQMLRDWLNEQTGGLLQNQIKQVRLDKGTPIRLVTTVYFTAQ